MSLSLLASKRPGRDLQEILRRLVAGVARDLDALPDRAEDRVHDIRVRMKKFRAILRLTECALSKQVFAKSDKLARKLKDHFGSVRDNDVQADLLLDLLEKSEAAAAVKTLGLDVRGAESGADTSAAIETCSRLALLLDQQELAGLTCGDLLEAWELCYRSSRRAMRACCKDADDDFLFHEWRKRVKSLLYQSAAIGPPLDSLVAKTDRLASVLGSHHDLSILTGNLSARMPGSKAERAARSRKKSVAGRAVRLGQKLFRNKPSAMTRMPSVP